MTNAVLKPNVAPQHDRPGGQAMVAISDLLLQLERGLTQISAVAERCTDVDIRRELRTQSAAVSDLIAQARDKAARIISHR